MKPIITFVFIVLLKFSAFSQCTITDSEVRTTCNGLRKLMDCYLIKSDFNKALATYLAFESINKEFQTPLDVKTYFNTKVTANRNSFIQIKLGLNGPEVKTNQFTSTMPRVVKVTQ